jgi:hypothetical protein
VYLYCPRTHKQAHLTRSRWGAGLKRPTGRSSRRACKNKKAFSETVEHFAASTQVSTIVMTPATWVYGPSVACACADVPLSGTHTKHRPQRPPHHTCALTQARPYVYRPLQHVQSRFGHYYGCVVHVKDRDTCLMYTRMQKGESYNFPRESTRRVLYCTKGLHTTEVNSPANSSHALKLKVYPEISKA